MVHHVPFSTLFLMLAIQLLLIGGTRCNRSEKVEENKIPQESTHRDVKENLSIHNPTGDTSVTLKDLSHQTDEEPWWVGLKSSDSSWLDPETCKDLESFRLPTVIRPTHYQLGLRVTNETTRFSGAVKISIELNHSKHKLFSINGPIQHLLRWYNNTMSTVSAEQDQIVLHASESLVINDIWYESVSNGGKNIGIKELCRQGDMLKITLKESLRNGHRGELFIFFDAQMQSDFGGLYRTRRTDRNNEPTGEYDLLTQLQPTDARSVFPCFDEPSFKATFSLTLLHPDNLTPLSNTNPIRELFLSDDNLMMTQFETTPKMSSYLFALSLGEYEHVERKINGDTLLVRVFNNKGKRNPPRLLLDTACSCIQEMQKYTGIAYTLDKFDLLTVHDFSAGAMENWGLTTYVEDSFVYEPYESDMATDSYALKTVAHEVAHQWFGNLVTANWWTEIWLNEGFSELFSEKLMDKIEPRLDFKHSYLIHDLQKALLADMNPSVHPIQRLSVEGNSQIESTFDNISYNKASAVLRMLENLIGPELMQSGVRNYLSSLMYGSAEPEDLMKVFDRLQTDQPVRLFLESWIRQPHFPLVDIEMDSRGKLQFRQQCFSCANNTDQYWLVPLTVMFGHEPSNRLETMSTMMMEPKWKMSPPSWFNITDPGSWLKVNKDYKGYYNVRYSQQLLLRLRRGLKQKGALSAADKINLLDELTRLVVHKQSNPLDLVSLMLWIAGDASKQHGAVWHELASAYVNLDEKFDDDATEYLNGFAHRFFSPVLYQFGFRPTSESSEPSFSDDLGRPVVLRLLVSTHHQPTIDQALAAFDQSVSTSFPPNLREPIFMAVIRAGTPEQVRSLLQLYNNSSSLIREDIEHVLTEAGFNKAASAIIFPFLKNQTTLTDHLDIFKSWAQSLEGRKFLIDTIRDESAGLEDLQSMLDDRELAELVQMLVQKQKNRVNELFASHRLLDHWSSLSGPVEARVRHSLEKLKEVLNGREPLDYGTKQDVDLSS